MLNVTLAILMLLAQDTGTVKGTVTLKGEAPPGWQIPIKFPEVKEVYPSGYVIPAIPLDGDHHVQSCLVYVRRGLEGKTFEVPKAPLRLTFRKFLLEPRIAAMMANQPLVIEGDGDFHNIHSLALDRRNKEFNSGLPRGGNQEVVQTFAAPELGIKLKCDVHEWSYTYVTVLSHPFFSVTDAKGQFEIKGLPAGKYTLEAWQENCLPSTLEIEVKSAETTVADFNPEPGPFLISAWDLKAKPEEIRRLEGKIVVVDGHYKQLPGAEGVLLQVGQKTWSGTCSLKPGALEQIQSSPGLPRLILRGRLKGLKNADGDNFAMEDCDLEYPPGR